ncbi:MAG: HD domain-containing protein [Pseudobdellovibrionaceae bacterium]|nr:HD domain-containing protein [Bdellovibrionales bacterium]USN47254.1 MAG: HD domain-containing protein [Pseudobdellovibrionaceae bacterium]
MEIRDPIHGSIELSRGEEKIIDSAAYQRLRQIKQLGFSEFSFPGATHNRFIHSIGACHLAGRAFDSIFRDFKFSTADKRALLRQSLRLAALLHDVGHGPLSHTTEEVMPFLSELKISAYEHRRTDMDPSSLFIDSKRRADHEDYTIKFVTDSPLAEIIRKAFPDINPLNVACLIDNSLQTPDDFFHDQGFDFRTIFSQLVSSELDVDRMDYLERDAYFCGTNYGRVELGWLLANLTYHPVNGRMHLALNRRALYTFDDFLLSRHHMHLMVYFHHKAIIYEEMLLRFLTSKDCGFRLPADINQYIHFTDYSLYQHMATSDNEWAKRISNRRPYKMLFELHSTEPNPRAENMKAEFERHNVKVIYSNSTMRLSKYHGGSPLERVFPIYVVDHYDRMATPYPIEDTTEIFQKYEEIRRIERLYVAPEQFDEAETLLVEKRM